MTWRIHAQLEALNRPRHFDAYVEAQPDTSLRLWLGDCRPHCGPSVFVAFHGVSPRTSGIAICPFESDPAGDVAPADAVAVEADELDVLLSPLSFVPFG